MNGYWQNGVWYPYFGFQYAYPVYNYPVYGDQSSKVIEQLLKRIADLEAKLETK